MSRSLLTRVLTFLVILMSVVICLVAGCDDERAVQLAREAANRQAQQNNEIARQNHEIAKTTRNLVEADSKSRAELVALQRDLQVESTDIAKQRDALEAERRQQANARLTESILAPILESTGVLLVCALVIAFGCYLVAGLRNESEPAIEISELLVTDLLSEQPQLMPPPHVVTTECLPGPALLPKNSASLYRIP